MSIFYHFRDIAGHLSKVADFDPPHLHLASVYGLPWQNFQEIFGVKKTRFPWAIVWFCLCDPMFSRFSRTPTCDRQTDTDTGPWLVPHGKNWSPNSPNLILWIIPCGTFQQMVYHHTISDTNLECNIIDFSSFKRFKVSIIMWLE